MTHRAVVSLRRSAVTSITDPTMHHPVASAQSAEPSSLPMASAAASPAGPPSSPVRNSSPPPPAPQPSLPSNPPARSPPPPPARVVAPLSTYASAVLSYATSPSSLFFLLLALAHLLLLVLNPTPVPLHLLVLTLPSTLSSLLLLTSLYAATLTALFFVSFQSHLVGDLALAREATALAQAEAAGLRAQLGKLRSAAATILVPVPLDQLVDRGLDVGMRDWQHKQGMMHAVLRPT